MKPNSRLDILAEEHEEVISPKIRVLWGIEKRGRVQFTRQPVYKQNTTLTNKELG